jgi:hypothetical protein
MGVWVFLNRKIKFALPLVCLVLTSACLQKTVDRKNQSIGPATSANQGGPKVSTRPNPPPTPPDTTAPSISLTEPANNANASGIISISASATDNVGVAGVQFKLDGVNLGAEVTTSPYTILLDTGTLINGSHTLSAEARDAAGNRTASTSISISTLNFVAPSLPVISTPNASIPNFSYGTSFTSIGSGNWSDSSTWSAGRVPADGDVVAISSSHLVIYDVNSIARIKSLGIRPNGKLKFRVDINTKLIVTNLLIEAGGELEIGTAANPVPKTVSAQIVIANEALDTVNDPQQYGNGLVSLGKVVMHGAERLPFVRLTQELRVGSTTATLSQAVIDPNSPENPYFGWKVGDKLVIPDTKAWASQTYPYPGGKWEEVTLTEISADGRTITFDPSLQYDHLGAKAADNLDTIDFYPHILNRSRSVRVGSESSTGTRGHVMFTERATVDIRYSSFTGLGRTKIDAENNTTWDNGIPNHIGTNQSGRHPINFHHLMGPATTPSNGYQYTFLGNAVNCLVPLHRVKWGIAIKDSHYGLIKDNTLYNWNGAALMTITGNESYNLIENNIAVRGYGEGDRQAFGSEGVGFWLRGPNNYVRNNVAANFKGNQVEASYGFKYNMRYLPHDLHIPNFKGAHTKVAGQYTERYGNSMPLLEFDGNETYAVENGFTLWWVNSTDTRPENGGRSYVRNFRAWHFSNYGYYGYPITDVTFDGIVMRGDKYILYNVHESIIGMWFGDYMSKNVIIENSDIQGVRTGIIDPYFSGYETIIRNTKLRNANNIGIQTVGAPGSGGYGPHRGPKTTIIRNVDFGPVLFQSPSAYVGGGTQSNIGMWYTQHHGSANLIVSDRVFVYDYKYNGITIPSFRVFYNQQKPDFIVPKAEGNLAGSPVAGLTNAENWATYGIAIAGEITPCLSTRPEIYGFVCQ